MNNEEKEIEYEESETVEKLIKERSDTWDEINSDAQFAIDELGEALESISKALGIIAVEIDRWRRYQ